METKLRAVLGCGARGCAGDGRCARSLGSRARRFTSTSADGMRRVRRVWWSGRGGRDRSPGLIPAELEDEIVRLRKTLPLDNGAQTIAYHLARAGWGGAVGGDDPPGVGAPGHGHVPSHRSGRGRRGDGSSGPDPNDAWQIDATRWALRSGREVWVMDVLDDHSRLVVAARVCGGPTGDAAWGAFCDGTERYWSCRRTWMSDNGAVFHRPVLLRWRSRTSNETSAQLGVQPHPLNARGIPRPAGRSNGSTRP